jgi:hypothetical protein
LGGGCIAGRPDAGGVAENEFRFTYNPGPSVTIDKWLSVPETWAWLSTTE